MNKTIDAATGKSWHETVAYADLKPESMTRHEIGKTALLLVRTGDDLRVFSADCPHKGGPLEKGSLCDGNIVCPWHKAMFSAQDGTLVEPLAFDSLNVYPVEIRDGTVFVRLDPIERGQATTRAGSETVLIVGGGAAGTAAAVSLREFGFAGSVTIIDSQDDASYDRTALSKTVLAGKADGDAPPPLRSDDFWVQHDITRVKGIVTSMDAAQRSLRLQDGRTLQADHLVLAPGSTPKVLKIPGGDLPFVHTLRSAEDARAILDAAPGHGTAVVVGGNFIGMEVAASLRERGMEVSVVSPSDIPFEKLFGAKIGDRMLRLHQDNGVDYRGGRQVEAIASGPVGNRVVLDNGEALSADVVVVGVGVEPALGFAGPLVDEDGGIAVDDTMAAAPGIYVAGDCARVRSKGRTIRIEHWRSAEVQGRRAARAIAGVEEPEAGLPWFWTQQFGKKLEYVGAYEPFDDVTITGDLESFDFVAHLNRDGRHVGTVSAGQPKATIEAVVHGQL